MNRASSYISRLTSKVTGNYNNSFKSILVGNNSTSTSKWIVQQKRGYSSGGGAGGLFDTGKTVDSPFKTLQTEAQRIKESEEHGPVKYDGAFISRESELLNSALTHDINRSLEIAATAYEMGQHEKALERLYWVLHQVPYETGALLQRAVVYEDMGRFDDAIKDCNQVVKISNQSDHLLEAFTIKGVCLTRLQKYNDAIVSYEQALLIENNDEILALKKKAEELANPDAVKVPEHDDDYQFFNNIVGGNSNTIVIKKSLTHGRGIFAARDIEAEELLFETKSHISLPLSHDNSPLSIHKSKEKQHCDNCHISYEPLVLDDPSVARSSEFSKIQQFIYKVTSLPLGKIQPIDCTTCNDTSYCSPKCETEGKLIHSSVCSSFNHIKEKFLLECSKLDSDNQSLYILLFHLLSKLFSQVDPNKPLDPIGLDDFTKRLTYMEPARASPQYLNAQDKKFYQLLKTLFAVRELTPELFYRCKSLIKLNYTPFFTSTVKVLSHREPMDDLGYTFDFEDQTDRDLIGLMYLPSFINHSCEPNAFIAPPIINDQSIRYVSNRPIKKGEEIFISYLEAENISTKQRRELLFNNYNFMCHCPSCIAGKEVEYLSKGEMRYTFYPLKLCDTEQIKRLSFLEQILHMIKAKGPKNVTTWARRTRSILNMCLLTGKDIQLLIPSLLSYETAKWYFDTQQEDEEPELAWANLVLNLKKKRYGVEAQKIVDKGRMKNLYHVFGEIDQFNKTFTQYLHKLLTNIAYSLSNVNDAMMKAVTLECQQIEDAKRKIPFHVIQKAKYGNEEDNKLSVES
eukprot:gene5398-6732_t